MSSQNDKDLYDDDLKDWYETDENNETDDPDNQDDWDDFDDDQELDDDNQDDDGDDDMDGDGETSDDDYEDQDDSDDDEWPEWDDYDDYDDDEYDDPDEWDDEDTDEWDDNQDDDTDDYDDYDDSDEWDDDEDEVDDSDDDPDNELSDTDKDAIIKKLRKENAARRKKMQELQDSNVGAVEETVGELIEGLSQAVGREGLPGTPEELFDAIELQVQKGAEARRDLAIYKAAAPLGIDTERLLDSRHFIDQVEELDSSSENYEAEIVRLVQSTASTAPHLKQKPQVQRSGADLNSGKTTTPKEDMSVEALSEARRKRRGIDLKPKD